MTCDECGQETDTIFEVRGYAGIYSLCATCFGPEEDEEESDDDVRQEARATQGLEEEK